MLDVFLSDLEARVSNVLDPIHSLVEECEENHSLPNEVLIRMQGLLISTNLQQKFCDFVQKRSEEDETWLFWNQFVFQDCSAYINLFLAIRTSDWHLRLSSLKLMAPVFTAFDRTTYQKLIPQHLADIILHYPEQIRRCFESAAFTVSITG